MGSIEREMSRQAEVQEPYVESSDDSFLADQRMGDSGLRLPSNVIPEDYFQYKKFINLPESQAEFSTKIDKDVVFANIGGKRPTLEELRFQVGTIELFESEFVEEIKIPRRHSDGTFVRDNNGFLVFDVELVFDEAFRGCLNFMKGQYKFDVVASRAQGGQDRAAFLDNMTISNIKKEFSKKKEQQSKFFGTGGGM